MMLNRNQQEKLKCAAKNHRWGIEQNFSMKISCLQRNSSKFKKTMCDIS